MNRFVLNETSYHGAGAINSIPEEIKGRGFKKVLVASDPDLVKFGVTKKVTDVLENAGIEYTLYSDIKPNPTIQNVQHGVEVFKESGADCIVVIGGGSSMDTAKAVGIAYQQTVVGLHTFLHFLKNVVYVELVLPCGVPSFRRTRCVGLRYYLYVQFLEESLQIWRQVAGM